MKKLILVMLIITIGSGLAFAEFIGAFGLYGGLGNAAGAGFSIQLGYLTPAESEHRWGIYLDNLTGIRYSLFTQEKYTYTDIHGYTHDVLYDQWPGDFIFSILGEYFILPFLAVSAGPGIALYVNDSNVFCFRSEINFMIDRRKLGFGFDYIFWDNELLPPGIKMPAGYRFNIHLRLQGNGAAFVDWLTRR